MFFESALYKYLILFTDCICDSQVYSQGIQIRVVKRFNL